LEPTVCPRCGAALKSYTTSYFNTEIICFQCKIDEKAFPNYERATAAERAAVQGGDYNYKGIGLAEADRVKMRQMIAARKDVPVG
jgi:hypothetical protein